MTSAGSAIREQTSNAAPSPRRLHIAFVSSGLGSTMGGIGVASQTMVDALQPEHHVQLWVNDTNLPRMLRHARVVGKAWVGEKPDFVFYGHVFLTQLHSAAPRLKKVPYGVFLHGIEVWTVLRERHRKALEGASVLVANSEHTLLRARQSNPWMPEARIAWLGVPANVERVDAGANPPTALIVGRLVSAERGKGHDEILSCWRSVRVAVPDARLIIVGEGDDRSRLERRVVNERIPGVEFRGYISDAERDALYQQSRALLFPSRQEGFGLVLAEAAAHGIPCLAVKQSVFEETFPEGNGVVFVENTSAEAMSPAIIRLLRDHEFACVTGRAAYERVQRCFTEQHFAERFRTVLRPLVP